MTLRVTFKTWDFRGLIKSTHQVQILAEAEEAKSGSGEKYNYDIMIITVDIQFVNKYFQKKGGLGGGPGEGIGGGGGGGLPRGLQRGL